MKKILILLILIMVLPIQSQDITNKLGGKTAAETFDITDPDDNILFRVQGDGNIGIGTTTPGTKLDIDGSAFIEGNLSIGNSSVDKQLFFNGSGGDAVMKMYPSSEFAIGTDASVDLRLSAGNIFKIQTYEGSMIDRFYIANDGKVGVGNSNPLGDLHVNGHIVIDRTSSNHDYMIGNNIYYNSGWKYIENGYGGMMTISEGGDFGLTTFPSGTAGNAATPTNRLYVTKDGNVGIGTTSPAQKLDVSGTAQMTGFRMSTGATNGHVLTSDGSGVGTWQDSQGGGDFSNGGEAGGADRTLGNSDNYALGFKTNNSTRLNILDDGGIRIDGNVGIFTNPVATATANRTLQLYDAAQFSNPFIQVSGHNSAYINLVSRRTGTTSGKAWRIGSGSGSALNLDRFFIYNADDGNCFTIRDGGNVGIATDNPLSKLSVGGSGYAEATLYSLNTLSSGYGIYVENATSGVGIYSESNSSGYSGYFDGPFYVGGNIGLGTTDFGGGDGIVALHNALTNPTTTLSDAAALYASSGELWAYDVSGNATQLSPHDSETGEWVFYSKNTITGRVVKINMEKLVKKIEEITGESFMEEWIEE